MMNGAEFNLLLGIYKELKKLNRHLESKKWDVVDFGTDTFGKVPGALQGAFTPPVPEPTPEPEPEPIDLGPKCAGCDKLIGNRGCMEWRGNWYHDECLP